MEIVSSSSRNTHSLIAHLLAAARTLAQCRRRRRANGCELYAREGGGGNGDVCLCLRVRYFC